MIALCLALLTALSFGALAFAKGPGGGSSTGLAAAQQDAETMSNEPVGSAGKSCEEKCPNCGRKKHDTGRYPRSKSERRKALLRDAGPQGDLPQNAKKFVKKHDGNNVPPGYEVSHEEPLYTEKDKSKRCKLDVAENMKTQKKKTHRERHKHCGDQFHDYPR